MVIEGLSIVGTHCWTPKWFTHSTSSSREAEFWFHVSCQSPLDACRGSLQLVYQTQIRQADLDNEDTATAAPLYVVSTSFEKNLTNPHNITSRCFQEHGCSAAKFSRDQIERSECRAPSWIPGLEFSNRDVIIKGVAERDWDVSTVVCECSESNQMPWLRYCPSKPNDLSPNSSTGASNRTHLQFRNYASSKAHR